MGSVQSRGFLRQGRRYLGQPSFRGVCLKSVVWREMQRRDVPSAADGNNVGVGLRLNHALIVSMASICESPRFLASCMSSAASSLLGSVCGSIKQMSLVVMHARVAMAGCVMLGFFVPRDVFRGA